MAIPFFKEIRIGGYLMKQKLLGRKRYPQSPHVGAGMLGRRRRMRRPDGGDPRRRAVDPQGNRRDRARSGGTQEIRVVVHQRAAAGKEARSVRAVAISVFLGASGR